MSDLYEKLRTHIGHEIVCVIYADGQNVAVECETCNCVLEDAYREDEQ